MISSGTIYTLQALCGTSATDVYAVGCMGTIPHFDGTTWTPENSGTAQDPMDVTCFDAGRVVAVGRNGTILEKTASGRK